MFKRIFFFASVLAFMYVLEQVPKHAHTQIKAETSGRDERYQFAITYHARMDGTVPDHSVLFIGDSFTAGLCTDSVISPSVNYGIGSDTTEGVLRRLPLYTSSMTRASAVVLEIGINDMEKRSDEVIIGNICKIVHTIPKGPRIFLCAIMPASAGNANARRTQIINARLRETALALDCGFIDPTPLLTDTEGFLLRAYSDNDRVHLNLEGNKIWIKELRRALTDLYQQHTTACLSGGDFFN